MSVRICRVKSRARLLSGEAGFTLIEVLVAAVILIVGLMGTFAMIDGAHATQTRNKAREGANNIARQVLEPVATSAYSAVNDTYLVSTMQSLPGYVSTSGMTAVVTQRNLTYRITAAVCSVDDPKDNLGTTDAAYCGTPHSASATNPDLQPDDLKRVSVSVTWDGPGATTVRQTVMLASNGSATGIPIATFDYFSPTPYGASALAPIITAASTTNAAGCSAGNACFKATAPGAKKIIFSIDGTDVPAAWTARDATCPASPANCDKWQLNWSLSGLSDGVYRVTARSVDTNDVEGTPKVRLVTLARGGMSAPCGVGSDTSCLPLEGGYNDLPSSAPNTSPIFEVRWQANSERNVVGYKVERNSTGTAGSGTVVCTLDAQGRVTSAVAPNQDIANAPGIDPYACIDTSPPAPSTTPAVYGVYALYTNGSTGAVVNGPVSTVSQAGGTAGSTTTHPDVTKTFGFDDRSTSSGCTRNMTDGWGGSGTSVLSPVGPGTVTFCTPLMSSLFPGRTSVTAKGPVTVQTTMNLNGVPPNKCTLTWALRTGATTLLNNTTGIQFSGGGDKQTPYNTGALALGATNVPLGQRLSLDLIMAAPGSDCDRSTVQYGGTTTGTAGNPAPGSVTVTFGSQTVIPAGFWSRPASPTGVGRTAVGGTQEITWTAPASGNVDFYRIYRGGNLYKNRIDTCDVGDTSCDLGGGSFKYVDQNPTGTTTYYVSAVYGSGTPMAATMAESPLVATP